MTTERLRTCSPRGKTNWNRRLWNSICLPLTSMIHLTWVSLTLLRHSAGTDSPAIPSSKDLGSCGFYSPTLDQVNQHRSGWIFVFYV